MGSVGWADTGPIDMTAPDNASPLLETELYVPEAATRSGRTSETERAPEPCGRVEADARLGARAARPLPGVAWNAAIAANKAVATSAATTVNSRMASDPGQMCSPSPRSLIARHAGVAILRDIHASDDEPQRK